MDEITIANNLINKYYSNFILFDTFRAGDLGKAAVQYVLADQPGVAYHVLSQLQKRAFASSDIVHVAREILDGITQAKLNELAKTANGMVLIKMIGAVLKFSAPGNKNSARSQKLQVAIDYANPKPKGAQPRQLSQAEMDWYVNYNQTKLIFYERDAKGTIHPSGGKRNNFDSAICWELPTRGTGYVVYNLNDLNGVAVLKDEKGYDQIGTKETIEAMIRIASEWNKLHPDKLLQYGDVSRPGGINTPDHKTHNNGKAFDMRPLRNDSMTGNVPTPKHSAYHRDLTKAFILLVVKLYPGTTFYFNDEELHTKDRDVNSVVDPSSGHDNHLHVMFPGGN